MSASVTPAEDDLVFMDENSTHGDGSTDPQQGEVWRIMIVDDDEDVHSSTTFALSNLEIQHRPLKFLHAYSAAEARDILKQEHDIAVILLDVVMEQEDAGLQLVRHIRENCGMADARIILRTGQPGYAPEIEAIRDYDINDYKTKSELTRIKLFTTVTAAIRSYEQIRAINASRRGLDLIVRASTELMALHGLQNFAAGVLTQLAGLLMLPPDGLLCLRDEDTNDGPQVVAAVGNYVNFVNLPVSAIGKPKLLATLSRALKDKRNIYAADHTALYFSSNKAREFAAYLDTRAMRLSDTDKRLLEVFCSNISVGLDNVMLVSRLHESAFYDPLCKLPNRNRLAEIITETLAAPPKKDMTLALVDIDHFSEINDTLGHQFGDQLLLGIAARLKSQLSNQVVVGRVGGDTFSLLGNGKQINPASILSMFNTPFSIDGEAVQLSATVGLVRLADYQGGSGITVVKDADIALKRAKSRQRAGHSYFAPNMQTEIHERVRMMHSLRSAFEKKRLFVVYQPQIDLATRRSVGAEALLRWRADDGALIPPDSFIPIAEYSGLIIDLGEWVLRCACQELVRLRRLGFHDFMMSVNVSQAQFRHPRFLDMLRLALEDTQAPATALELEITESMAMEDPATLIQTIEQIKRLGVSVAIDDFGTGFSSLNYLQQLHVDRIKIDRAFVTEITSASRGSSIAEMIIQLGQNLGLSVIAEGVEDQRQADILQSLGCPLAQGFLFARPMMADQLPDWLRADNVH
jgi:diguanylate cyclase (GGDEF)-like protein